MLGGNLIGADVECEELKYPYGYYKSLGCKKISSYEDIGLALKNAKKGFFGLGRTWKVQQQNLHYVEDLVLIDDDDDIDFGGLGVVGDTV